MGASSIVCAFCRPKYRMLSPQCFAFFLGSMGRGGRSPFLRGSTGGRGFGGGAEAHGKAGRERDSIPFFPSIVQVIGSPNAGLPNLPMIGTCTTALDSCACSTRSRQYGFTVIDLHLAIMNKKYFARVSATFILRTSLRNPIPWLPDARTAENITMFASRPWKASTVLTSTRRL